ncbi:hypothetical protein Tco_1127863 [Tanacetum coccineum]
MEIVNPPTPPIPQNPSRAQIIQELDELLEFLAMNDSNLTIPLETDQSTKSCLYYTARLGTLPRRIVKLLRFAIIRIIPLAIPFFIMEIVNPPTPPIPTNPSRAQIIQELDELLEFLAMNESNLTIPLETDQSTKSCLYYTARLGTLPRRIVKLLRFAIIRISPLAIPFFVMETVNPQTPPIPPNPSRDQIIQELDELLEFSAMIDSHLENLNDLEPDLEFEDVPPVSPFIDSCEELDDADVIDDIGECEIIGELVNDSQSLMENYP